MNHSELKSILHYDPDTGRWTRITSPRSDLVDEEAGFLSKEGYRIIKIGARSYKAHRLAVFYMTEQWPTGDVDHKDLVRSNNAWKNIRPATRAQNQMNTRIRSDNFSGKKGVHWRGRDKAWAASIRIDGRLKHLGTFRDPDSAHAAYCAAASQHFGEFARSE